MGGTRSDETWKRNYIDCKDKEMHRLFPTNDNDRQAATDEFRTWSRNLTNNPDGHVILEDGSDTIFTPQGVADGVTTLGRVWLILLFIGMWGLMVFPVIYDIIVVTAHYVVTFTPKAYDQDAILRST